MSRTVRRSSILVALPLLISIATPPVGVAQDETPDVIADAAILSATIDVKTRLPTVVITATCVTAAEFVRVRLLLTQSFGKGQLALSLQSREGNCVAGQVLNVPVVFGPQVGRFLPGPAQIDGFVEARQMLGFPSDVESIPLTELILHPG